jgi:ribulose-phosphate 3-epimerase
MAIVCPTITAFDLHEYRRQIEVASSLATRIHIDLMDGVMAPSVSPNLGSIWLPHETINDIHLMYKNPLNELDKIIKLHPNMVIIQAEANVDHMYFASQLHKHGIKAGVSILQSTQVKSISNLIHSFDQVLIFSGNLGFQGGSADLSMLHKINEVKYEHPDAEIAWDGGINENNSKRLVEAGIEVLNVGGFIQKSKDPKNAYQKIVSTLL